MRLHRRIIRIIKRLWIRENMLIGEKIAVDQSSQILLSMMYKEILYAGRPLPSFQDVGFRVFSQSDEDGLLLYIFSLIGVTNKKAIEVSAGDGIEGNTANFIRNHGWIGLLFDADKELVEKGRAFYTRCKDTTLFPPIFVQAWIDTANINSLIVDHGFEGEIDLLSIDIDGVDFWIWKAIDCINPRVIVVEYLDVWGPDRAVTVPYCKDFDRLNIHRDYFGASLAALVKLGRDKGYRLVGCNRYGFNAFFIRNDVGIDILPEISPDQCFVHPKTRKNREARVAEISQYEWIEV